ncbi:MAG TPA: ABC transporter permease, partial [Natronincola sp.]|nr:ABC transporter permease [Natronincola sp.]
MKHYFWQKTISAITTVFLVSLLTFVILQVLPGDPALLMLGTEGNPESYDRLRMELRLDEPILKRYFIWLGQFLQGNLGVSQRFSMPISKLVGDALPL